MKILILGVTRIEFKKKTQKVVVVTLAEDPPGSVLNQSFHHCSS